MPVFDWVKTELKHGLPDGSNTLAFDQKMVEGLTPRDMVDGILKGAGDFQLPGWEPERLELLEEVLKKYKDIDEKKLRENYKYFLEAIIPICEDLGIKMAVHPDDPAWPIFDIPRITSTVEDLEKIVNLVDSPSNTLLYVLVLLAPVKKMIFLLYYMTLLKEEKLEQYMLETSNLQEIENSMKQLIRVIMVL